MNEPTHPTVTVPSLLPSALGSPLAFLFCWLATAVGLYLIASPPLYPTVFPDELSNLSWARYLSGTAPHYVLDLATYRHPIYPALLAPVFWLFEEPNDIFKGIFAVNTLLVAACLPLAIRLAITGFGVSTGAAWLVGMVVMAYPSLTLVNHHAWPESTLYPLVLVAFLALNRWLNQPDWRRATFLGLMCALLYAMHPKMLIFPIAFLGGVTIGLVRNHRDPHFRIRALLAILVSSLFFLLLSLVGAQATNELWNAAPVDVIGRFTEHHPLDFLTALSSKIAGQFVYAAVITGGLVWLLCATGIQTSWIAFRQGMNAVSRVEWQVLITVLMILLMAVETGIFLLKSTRFDTLFYGRHLDPLLAASLVPALALILQRRIRWSTVTAALILILICIVTLALTLPVSIWNDYSRIHVQGLGFIMDDLFTLQDRSSLLLWLSALMVGTASVAVVAMTTPLRWAGLMPLLAILILAHTTNRPFSGILIEEAIPSPVAHALDASRQCHIEWHSVISGRLALHQFYRLQYHYPHCTIQSKEKFNCNDLRASKSILITSMQCPESVSHKSLALPPDLWLYLPEK